MAQPYNITIESAFEGGRATEIKLTAPVGPRSEFEFGTRWPSVEQVANYYAGEFCDSGTVRVTRGTDRARVARRQFA